MMNPNSFDISVIGARHIQQQMPCQDYATTFCEGGVAVAVVCDGHGGEPYFRSDVGARFAAEAAVACIQEFIATTDSNAFVRQPYRAYSHSVNAGDTPAAIQTFRPLFAAILRSWLSKIIDHIAANPFTDAELQLVPDSYRDYLDDIAVAATAYGTTLIAYAQCRDYWFAFQIGDGKLIVFHEDECGVPIPDDPHCHDNITTSLCDLNALDEFRFCIDGSGKFPLTAFACTDGVEKCFETEDKMAEYLYKISQLLLLGRKDLLLPQLQVALPKFSALTSGDDLSLASIYIPHTD